MSDWTLTGEERAEVTALLTGLVNAPSPDPPGDEAAIAEFLADWLASRGFEVTRDEFQPGRINVLARLQGGDRPGLVFLAHMDTLPVGEAAWTHAPFAAEIDADVPGGRLYGRGAADMKSGLAAMAAAALKWKRSGRVPGGDLILAFSAGESSNCLGAQRMVDAGSLTGAGALLVSEPSSLNLLTAETGALWLRVRAEGRSGHASASGADNAIWKLIDFLDAVRGNPLNDHHHPLLGTASIAVNTIGGGTAVNLTADRAEASLDIRTVPGMTTDGILEKLRGIAGDGLSIDIIDDKPSIVTDPDDPFVETCRDAVATVRGTAPEPGGVRYFSDSAILGPALNLPRVIIGPGQLGLSGQRDEWVDLNDVCDAAAIYGEIAERHLGAV